MVVTRRMVRQHFGQAYHPVYRALARMLAMTVWPTAVLVNIWQIRRFRGPKAVPMKRIPDAVWVALRHNVLPGEYYAYALWLPDRRVNIDNYLYSNEASRLFGLLNRPSQPDPIGDKLAFHEMCKAHALPTPSVLAEFDPTGKPFPSVLAEFDPTGKPLRFEPGRPPEMDLFVKPRFGLAGDGTERLRWQGATFESNRGHHIKSQELSGYLAARAQKEKRTLLVQPVLSNHSDLRLETNAGLATARLVTGLSLDGELLPIFGFIYFARSNRITAQHGRVALIDVASGRLNSSPLQATSNQLDESSCILPDWNAALQYAQAAHRICSNFVFVGWDLAFTDRGPMLLEGNANWNADEYQSLSGQPLGHTKFANILATRMSGVHF
jgi:hypothetical protein